MKIRSLLLAFAVAVAPAGAQAKVKEFPPRCDSQGAPVEMQRSSGYRTVMSKIEHPGDNSVRFNVKVGITDVIRILFSGNVTGYVEGSGYFPGKQCPLFKIDRKCFDVNKNKQDGDMTIYGRMSDELVEKIVEHGCVTGPVL